MDFLLIDGLRPFSILAALIVVFLAMEIVLLLIGLSSDVDIGLSEGDTSGAIEVDPAAFDGNLFSADELAVLDLSPDAGTKSGPSALRRILGFLGIGRGPLLVSLIALAAGVSSLGFLLQLTLDNFTGSMLSAPLALAIVALPGLWLGGRLASFANRLVPSFESHGISEQTYHGRRGQVVIGTARRGDPAQIRWQDMYGTTHSLMAEPLRDEDRITEGTEVLIVKTRARQPRIVTLP